MKFDNKIKLLQKEYSKIEREYWDKYEKIPHGGILDNPFKKNNEEVTLEKNRDTKIDKLIKDNFTVNNEKYIKDMF